MKKVLVVLLILAVAGGVFAQGLTLAGYVRSGVVFWIPDSGDPMFVAHNPDPGQAARMELNGTYTTAAGNGGGAFRLRFQYDMSAVPTLTIPYAYVWYKPFADMLQIYAGRMDQNNFGTGGGVDASGGVGSGSGVRFESAPITGLLLGVGLYPGSATPWAFKNGKYAFGAKYSMANTFVAVANFTIENKAIGLNAGVDLQMLKSVGLTKLAFDVGVARLDDFDANGVFQIGERVDFAKGDIGFGLRAKQYLPVGKIANFELVLHAYFQYALMGGDITPRLDVAMTKGGTLKGSSINNTNGAGDYRGTFDGLNAGVGNKDSFGVIINPNVAFKVGGGTITAGYSAMIQSKTNAFNNAIYCNFNVPF